MKARVITFSFLFLSLTIFSCRGLDINIFPDSYDVNLGAQFVSDITAKPGEYPIMNSRQDIKGYITQIGNKILASPDIKKRSAYQWTFDVIQDDKTINAFCVPGGHVYVYTGLIKFLDDEATLAGVIAHEIAHAEKRHSSRRITGQLAMQLGAGVAMEILLGDNAETWKKTVVPLCADLLVSGVALFNSRDDEYEADEYSFKYLSSTEYFPGAIKGFFVKVDDNKSRGGFDKFVSTLFSTHPLPPDRLAKMDALVKKNNYGAPTDQNLFVERYYNFKKTLP